MCGAVDCTICRLLEGLLPSWRIYENESTVAFLDIGQATRGHTLVVPRRHAEYIWALSEEEAHLNPSVRRRRIQTAMAVDITFRGTVARRTAGDRGRSSK